MLIKLYKILKKNYRISLVVIIVILILNHNDWYRLFSKKEIEPVHLNLLKESGEKAIDHLDIPVGAILIHENKVIGIGYNTVLRDNNAAGHAEINAISDALSNIGHDEFSKLERNSMKLITTYEPCLMCRGAIINFRIKNVYFVQKKSISNHMHNKLKNLKYDFFLRKTVQDTLQEYLFKKHPEYESKRN